MADDEQNNPSRNVADDAYKRTFKTSKQLQEMESAATEDSKETKDKKSQNSDPDKAHWKTKDIGKADKEKVPLRRTPLGRVRHGSAYMFVIGLILLGVWFSSVFAPNIIMVNMKEMFTNDLADATVALYNDQKKLLNNKIGTADCGDKDTIKCKLSTMPRQLVKSLEKAGFTVNGDKVEEDNLDDNDPSNDKPESRYKVTSIVFPHNGGTASSGDSFEQNANKSSGLKSLTYSVFHPKSSFFMDTRYKDRIKWRYDLTKNPTVAGNTEEEVNKSFDKSMQGDDEKIDEAGGGAFSLKTLGDDKGKDGLKKTSETVGDTAFSYTGLQCAYYTQGKVVSNAAKKAKQITVARFAMQYLKAADQIKAGQADEITANTLSGKLAWSSDGGYNGKNGTDAVMYRHILFNEPANDSQNGMKYYLDAFDSIGSLFPAWLQTVMITSPAVKGIARLPGGLAQPPADIGSSARDYCLEGQKDSNKAANKPNDCPALTVAGTPIPMQPAVAPIAALSDRICPMPPKGCCWMMYPTTRMTEQVVMPYVQGVFTGAVAGWANKIAEDFTSNTKGIAASDAMFAGTGEILGDMAMSRGMRPADKNSLSTYLKHEVAIKKEFEQVARYDARKTPFDASNQYSFLGSIVRSLGVAYNQDTSLLSSVFNVFSLIPSSVQNLVSKTDAFYYIQPLELDTSRLRCPDAEYKAIGIEADVACNVRYSMSDTELNAKVSDVLDYMLKSHSDETKDGIQELEKRLQVTDNGADTQDKQDVQRQLDEAKEGSNAKMIDEKTGKPVKHSEYEKFMNYCVNREDPWGRSGIAVRREGLSDEEKEERMKDKDKNGNPISENDSGDPNELKIAKDKNGKKAAYMSTTEGTAADQDWYTGKKCLEESEMLNNFRAYTMMCSVDGSYSGGADCTEKDNANTYFDGFYNNNDILYTSWW